jgi:glycosyltransferase involved in cell wall biosynthesis
MELVVVDDASTDGSAGVIRELERKYARRFHGITTVFHGRNAGAHAAINEGVRAARGRLAAILNADDLYEKDRFSQMAARAAGRRMAISAVHCIDADGMRLFSRQALDFEDVLGRIAGAPFMAAAAAAENVAVSTGNMLFEKSLFEELGGFRNYKYVHDYDFFVRACLLAEPAFVPETAYLYRLHGENSFVKLAREGPRENRMVWLELYHAVRAGNVKNPVMLGADYKEQFLRAVRAAGVKKEALWRMSGNPALRAVLAAMKRVRRVD